MSKATCDKIMAICKTRPDIAMAYISGSFEEIVADEDINTKGQAAFEGYLYGIKIGNEMGKEEASVAHDPKTMRLGQIMLYKTVDRIIRQKIRGLLSVVETTRSDVVNARRIELQNLVDELQNYMTKQLDPPFIPSPLNGIDEAVPSGTVAEPPVSGPGPATDPADG